jgi:long-subunit acyl-CoA synthetase (AMP-forming)
MSTFLPNAQFNLGQSMPNYFKAFTNYMSYIAKRYGGNDMLRYPSPNKDGVTFNTLSFEQVDRIATNLAYKLSKQTQGHDTVAFLGSSIPSDLIAMLALLKLRVVMLCISPASSQMSVESLLQKTNCKLVMTDKTLLHSAGEYLGANVVEFPQLNLEALSREPLDPKASKMINTNFSDNDITKTALIIHR